MVDGEVSTGRAVFFTLSLVSVVVESFTIFAVLFVAVIAVWLLRGHWASKLPGVNLPDPRDADCYRCIPWGWFIMDFCCPFGARYHTAFGLRLMIVKTSIWSAENAPPKTLANAFARVSAGRNPLKTTSIQPAELQTRQSKDHSSHIVNWNEPLELVMQPSYRSVNIDIVEYQQVNDPNKENILGSVSVEVDAFFKDPGVCPCWCCGVFWPRVFQRICSCPYHWPAVRGAPTYSSMSVKYRCYKMLHYCSCMMSRRKGHSTTDFDVEADLTSARGVYFAENTDNGSGTAHSDDVYQKRHAIHRMHQDGLNLRDSLHWMQGDRDIVLAAVSQNAAAIEFASPELKSDREVLRVATRTPEPAILELTRDGKVTGRLWAYFIMYAMDEGLSRS